MGKDTGKRKDITCRLYKGLLLEGKSLFLCLSGEVESRRRSLLTDLYLGTFKKQESVIK